METCGVSSVEDCAKVCSSKIGCQFFTFGYDSGPGYCPSCAIVHTDSEDCPEGWKESGTMNVYSVSGKHNCIPYPCWCFSLLNLYS